MQSINLPGVLAAALVGAVVGFFVGQSMVPEPEIQVVTEYVSEESGEKVVPEGDLPLATDLLTNPMLTEWVARTEGVLASKNANSFVLERDGYQMRIFVNQGDAVSGFVRGLDRISLADVKVGEYMRGSVVIGQQGLAGSESVGLPVAQVFTVE